MDREIKFRAWDKEFRTMIYSTTRQEVAVGNNRCYILDDEPYAHQNSNLIPLQFTGLLDKNGKEIWEGDIVETARKTYRNKYWNARIFVTWSHAAMMSGFNVNPSRTYCYRVIGNIYENPELLLSQ